jgi:hypothetical protein
MTELEMLKRKILLKRQARDVISGEIVEMRIKLTLTVYKKLLEKQIAKDFDPAISRKLDAIQVLMEE